MDAIAERVQEAIREKAFPGCVIGISLRGGRQIFPFGTLAYEADTQLLAVETVYDLASITKSIPTASLAALLVAEGTLKLTDLVVHSVPELHNDYGATIEDLLRYRVHGAQMSTLRFETFQEIRTHALEHGFDALPGESMYTNLPAFILGIVIERVSGVSLQTFAHQRLFEPLGMGSTTFFPHPSDCAPTEVDGRGEVRGLPHDESAYVFAKARRTVGHAGLFSNASDLLTFCEALLNSDKQFSVIAEYARKGLGWQVNEPWMGTARSATTFGKTGFTGTSCLIDPEKGLALVILSNRTYPKRPVDNSAINKIRTDIADLVSET
jgi:CubicO group peptidase (beta-lactamase class C family)